MDILPLIVLFATFFGLMALGLPISFAMGLATLGTLAMLFPWEKALFILSQKLIGGFDSFTLLARRSSFWRATSCPRVASRGG